MHVRLESAHFLSNFHKAASAFQHVTNPFHKLASTNMPTNTRSRASKNVANPDLASVNSEPAKRHRGQAKKNTKPEDKGPDQASNQSTAPATDLHPKGQGAHEAAMNIPAVNDSNRMDNDSIPKIAAQPQKRGRKAAAMADEGDSAPPAKRTKEDGASSIYQLPHQQGKKGPARKKAAAVPRDPLLDCQGRNTHPAQPPARRRTPQEVAASQEAQRRAIEEAIQAGERAKQLLAQMNVSEDHRDNSMEAENPQRISVANRKRAHDELEGASDAEVFDFQDVDAMLDSPDEEPIAKGKAVSESNITE